MYFFFLQNSDGGVKSDTLEIIQSLLSLDPLKRATASQVLTKLTSVIAKRLTPETVASHDAQVVNQFLINRLFTKYVVFLLFRNKD